MVKKRGAKASAQNHNHNHPSDNGGRGRAVGGRGSGRGRGGFGLPDALFGYNPDLYDFSVNTRPETPRGRGSPFPNGYIPNNFRGRPASSMRGRDTPIAGGSGSPSTRGRGSNFTPRGRGGGARFQPDTPLSQLLGSDRPLLKPIAFVPSTKSPYLFQEEQEIFQPVAEDVAPGNKTRHSPTASRVARVFSSGHTSQIIGDESGEADVEEIDFYDMGKFRAEVDAINHSPEAEDLSRVLSMLKAGTSSELGNAKRPAHRPKPKPAVAPKQTDEALGFFVDTTPAQVQTSTKRPLFPSTAGLVPLGGIPLDDDEDIIVYVAPHPRSPSASLSPVVSVPLDEPTPLGALENIESVLSAPITETTFDSVQLADIIPVPEAHAPPTTSTSALLVPPSFSSVSFSFSKHANRRPRKIFATGSRPNTKAKLKRRRGRKSKNLEDDFSLFGVTQPKNPEEDRKLSGPDPKKKERRQGDSDVDWGSDSGAETGVALFAEENGADGMEIDPDLQIDVAAMQGFVNSMSAEGSRFVTMGDIVDVEQGMIEDLEIGQNGTDEDGWEENSSVDEEVAAALEKIEEMMLAGGGVETSEEEDVSEDDEDQTPRRGFQARLARLRENARGKKPAARVSDLESDDDDDDENEDVFLNDENSDDEDFDDEEDDFDEIMALLDDNADILNGRDRTAKTRLFNSIRNGRFKQSSGPSQPARKNKDKHLDIPPELETQWKKDREKKAENKRLRREARMLLAADPLSKKKGGKKGIKAMLAAANLDPTITVVPNRVFDVTTLVQQIRRFIANLGGPRSMALPPTDKETRKLIHEMAAAFNLKSMSKGNGNARYTTLVKTQRTGFGPDEKKIARLSRGVDHVYFTGGSSGYSYKDKGKAAAPRHKEGDEVGKAAPKLGVTNIGFQMLASMGWMEGAQIGRSGGLDAPLTAVIKTSKLGLGAMM